MRTLLFAALPHPRRLRAALALAPLGRVPLPGRLGAMARLAPRGARTARLAARYAAPPARARGRVALLTGCVQRVAFGDVNAATARVLAADGWEVVVPRQGCCGALSAHAGRAEEAERLTERLRRDLAGADAIAVNSSGCGSHLKEHGLPALDVSELLDERPRARLHPLATPRRLPGLVPPAPRAAPAGRRWKPLLLGSPALEVVEPAEQDICCGSAGIYNVAPARGRPRARRPQGRERPRHRRAGAREREPRLPRPALAGAAPAPDIRCPALHPVELVDASSRNVGTARLLTRGGPAAPLPRSATSAAGPAVARRAGRRARARGKRNVHSDRDRDRGDAADHHRRHRAR